MRVLVTGAAGFIGFHLVRRLLAHGADIVGVDSLSDYYDVRLKQDRLAEIGTPANFRFQLLDLADRDATAALFAAGDFEAVVHLAAQAGVRYSIKNPHAYARNNIDAFLNVLEGCRHNEVPHLVYASSSSVYGANTALPFSTHQNVDHPLSLYAATKKANELMAHTYSSLYGLPTTGLRFFTVYGPWGRPDMAMFRFADAILHGNEIDVYNHGRMQRDFTFVDDVVEALVRLLSTPATPNADWDGADPDPATSRAPYRLYNIGNNNPVQLKRLIEIMEAELGTKAKMRMLPMQPGDVPATYADVDDLSAVTGFAPSTPIEVGVRRFLEWYREYRARRPEPLHVSG